MEGPDANWPSIREQGLLVDKLGLDSIWASDHLGDERYIEDIHTSPPDATEPWTVLSAIASITQKATIGPCVLSMPYRYPAVLAKMAATLDHVSNGRLILGLGAGWNPLEFEAFGVPYGFEPFRTRYERLIEGTEIVRRLMVEDKAFDFKGKYYELKHAEIYPKPIQKPRPPIWIGGIGPKSQDFAARVGDGWVPGRILPPKLKEAYDNVKSLAKKYGRDPADIELAQYIFVSIAKDHDTAVEQSREYFQQQLKHKIDGWRQLKSVEEMGHAIGGPDDCIETLENYVKVGCEHFCIFFAPKTLRHTLEGTRLLAEKVIPYFRQGGSR
jgi:probable F420-dependent oxidoreductase